MLAFLSNWPFLETGERWLKKISKCFACWSPKFEPQTPTEAPPGPCTGSNPEVQLEVALNAKENEFASPEHFIGMGLLQMDFLFSFYFFLLVCVFEILPYYCRRSHRNSTVSRLLALHATNPEFDPQYPV